MPASRRRAVLLACLVLHAGAVAGVRAGVGAADVQAHKDRMNEAQDLKYEALDAFAAGDLATVGDAARRMRPLLDHEVRYWERTGLQDIRVLSVRNRALLDAVVAAAGTGSTEATAQAWSALEGSCSGCHDLHPEARVQVAAEPGG